MLTGGVAERVDSGGAQTFHDGILISELHRLQRPRSDLNLVGKGEIGLADSFQGWDRFAQCTVDHRGNFLARDGERGREFPCTRPLDDAQVIGFDDLGVRRVGERRRPCRRRLARQFRIQLHDDHTELLARDRFDEVVHNSWIRQPVRVGELQLRFCPGALSPIEDERVSGQYSEGRAQWCKQERHDKNAYHDLAEPGPCDSFSCGETTGKQVAFPHD